MLATTGPPGKPRWAALRHAQSWRTISIAGAGITAATVAAGQAIFEQALSQGVSREGIAAAIFGSSEYRQDLVESYYQAYLGRSADSGGLAAFVAALGQHTSDQNVVAAIAGSLEYFQKL